MKHLLMISVAFACACSSDKGSKASNTRPDTSGSVKVEPKPEEPAAKPVAKKPMTATSPKAGTQPDELVGSWRAAGTVGGGKGPGMAWFKEYTLNEDGTFVMKGYPPIQVNGKWRVTERDGKRLRLLLTDQQMRSSPREKPSKWNDSDNWIELDGAKFTWGKDVYSRMKTKP